MDGADERFMRQALRLARRGVGRTSPNPAVGAVIVRNGEVIARGYHRRAGEPHAEVNALARLKGEGMPGDTLYVTLEPCNHQGRTPPCTKAILERGIKKVVVGMRDPNPEVRGGGCEFLSARGVEVRTGILERECRRLNEGYLKFVTEGRPFVIAKAALTLDGWTGASTGHSRWISNETSRYFVHTLRDRVDAVMVGVGTILADDPLLNTRLKRGRGKNPIRIVLDTSLRIPAGARVLNHQDSSMTWIAVGEHVPPKRFEEYPMERVLFLPCKVREGKIDLDALMDTLGRKSITTLLLEGGATLMGAMIRAQLVDKFYLFKAPKLLGGNDGVPMACGPGAKRMEECIALKNLEIRRFGEDVLFAGYPVYGARCSE